MYKYLILLFITTLLIACESAPSAPEISAPARTSLSDNISPTVEDDVDAPFISKEGRFSINFPSTPKINSHTTSSEIGEIILNQFIYTKDNTQAWVVSYSDYPEKMIQLGNSEQLLKGIKYRILEDLHAKTLSEEQVKLEEKYNGLSFVAYAEKKTLDILYKIYLVNNRVYQVSMYSSIGAFTPQDSTNFIGSFKLIEERSLSFTN